MTPVRPLRLRSFPALHRASCFVLFFLLFISYFVLLGSSGPVCHGGIVTVAKLIYIKWATQKFCVGLGVMELMTRALASSGAL